MLLDIYLDELEFLVNPSYEFIKDKIPYIMEAYIKEFGEEYREHIEDNFGKINYVFLNEYDDLRIFITNFHKQLILEIYIKLYSAFNLEFREIIYEEANNNFIEKIFLKSGLEFIVNDSDLQIFRNNIRDYLIDIKENEQEQSTVKFLEDQIKYIDNTVVKFDQIMEILNPRLKLIDDIRNKKNKIKESLQREFIANHDYLLNTKEIELIAKEDDYDVEEFVKNSERLYKYVDIYTFSDEVFGIGAFAYFDKEYNDNTTFLEKRKEILAENGIDWQELGIDLNDGDNLLKMMDFYYIDENNNRVEGLMALTKLKEDLNNYDNTLCNVHDDYKYLMPRGEFIKKYVLSEEIIQRKCNKNNKEILSKIEDLLYIGNEFLKLGENSGFNNYLSLPGISGRISNDGIVSNFDIFIAYVCLSPIRDLSLQPNRIRTPFDSIFGHELGHVSTIGDKVTGLNLKNSNQLNLLNELINEYLNHKNNERIDHQGILFKSPCISNDYDASIYHAAEFLLEPIIDKYEDILKIASINNSANAIIDLMGQDLFIEYIDIINTFFDYKDSKYSYFMEESEVIKSVKKQINNIMTKVEEKNLVINHKKV